MKKTLVDLAFAALVCLVFCAAAVIFPSSGDAPNYTIPVAAIFGFLISFMISNAQTRVNNVDGLLKTHNGYVLLVYRLSKLYGAETQDKTRTLLDEYIVATIDYKLEDFNMTDRMFQKVYNFVLELGSTDDGSSLYGGMLDAINNISLTRTQIETQVREKITISQWSALFALTAITIWTFYEMSGNELMGIIATTISTAALMLLIIVLKNSDDLKWNNYQWTWRPLRELFLQMNLLPYFSDDNIRSGEIKLLPNEVFRKATYPNRYPNMDGKVVDVVDDKPSGAREKT